MRLPTPAMQRALVLPLALSTVLATAVLASSSPAAADALPAPISAAGLPTVQIDGVVWSQVVVGGTVYAGGSFGTARPAGAAPGVDTVQRTDLLAYDVTTGDLDTGFDPVLNGQVRAVAVSPDGSTLYVGGDFTQVNGQSRNHVAAFSTATGALTSFAPATNAAVYAIAVTDGTVFLGGSFTAVNGVTHTDAAAVDVGSGALTGFAPTLDAVVTAIAVSPDRTKVVLGGRYLMLDGAAGDSGLGAVSFLTGARLPWAASAVILDGGYGGTASNPSAAAGITSLTSRGSVVYATGFSYGYGNFEGTVAMNWSDGSIFWMEDCHGDSYSAVPYDGAVYVASHAHFCGNVTGGFDQTDPLTYHRATAFSQSVTGVLGHNTVESPIEYEDFGGTPAPTMLAWLPTLEPGTYTGAIQAAWSVAAGDGYVVYGGEFPSVDGVAQQGLTRFQGTPDDSGTSGSPDPVTPTPTPTVTPTPTATPTPTVSAPSAVGRPSVAALATTALAARWSAAHGAPTGYVVRVAHGSRTVKTVHVASTAKRTVTVKGLKKHTKYSVTVTASNAAGSGPASASTSVTTFTKGKAVSASKRAARPSKPSVHVKTTSVTVRWSADKHPGATAVTRYQIRIYRGSTLIVTALASSTSRSLAVHGLKAGTAYRVGIRALNFAGWSSVSSKRSVRTAS